MCRQQRFGFFQRLHRTRAGNRWKPAQKVLERVATFQVIEKGLDWNTCTPKYGNSVHRLRISGDGLCHHFIVSQAGALVCVGGSCPARITTCLQLAKARQTYLPPLPIAGELNRCAVNNCE